MLVSIGVPLPTQTGILDGSYKSRIVLKSDANPKSLGSTVWQMMIRTVTRLCTTD